MNEIRSAFLAIYLTAWILCMGITYWTYKNIGERRAMRSMTLVMMTGSMYNLAAALQVIVKDPMLSTFIWSTYHIIVNIVAPIWVAFVLVYTGAFSNYRRYINAVLFGEAFLYILIFITNPVHNLLFPDPTYTTFPYPAIEYTITPLWELHGFFATTVAGIAIVLLVRTMLNSNRHNFGQFLALGVGAGISVVGQHLKISGMVPSSVNMLAITSTTFAICALIGLYKFQLFDLTPIAREHVVDTIDDDLMVVNTDYVITEDNTTFTSIAGYNDLEGEMLTDHFDIELDKDTTTETTTEITTDEGETNYYNLRAFPVYNGDTHVGYGVLFRDVTDIEEKTRELERQTERLEQFASIVSHDLRNPLSVANAYVDLARDSQSEEDIETIADAYDRMDDLIDEVLTLAKEGSAIEDTEPVSVGDVAADAWDTVETGDTTYRGPGEVTIQADSTRLRTIFENLFRNSHDHGDPSTITVGLLKDGPGFYVADDGPGIPEDERDNIFEHGFTTDEDGTGLGLSIVKSIADAHGWDAVVTESDGGGAQFEFHFTDTETEADTDE